MSDLSMTRGDTKVVIETVDATGLGVNGIQGWSFWFTAKYDPADSDANAVVQKGPLSWQISQLGNPVTAGIAFCTLVPADTASLPGHRVDLFFDVQTKDDQGNIFTLDSGILIVRPDATTVTS